MSEAELEQLYARLEKPLYNVAYRWVWEQDAARDIVQEAFVRLWRMRQRVEMETVEPLVYRIALNLAATRRRSQKLWRWISLEALRDAPSDRRTAEETVFADEERSRVRTALESLPPEQLRVILLSEYSGLSYEEIADILSISPGTVGSRRSRAIKRLREVLSEKDTSRERGLPESV